ncbi:MAG: hypothetical protein ACPG5T_04560 [Endozoicomonas sp.]
MATVRKRILGVNKSAPHRVNMIAVQVADLQEMEVASGQIRSLLAQRHKLKPGQESAFRATNLIAI